MNKQQLKDAIAAEKKRHTETMKDLTSKLRVFELEDEARNRAAYKDRKKLLDKTGEWLNKTQVLKVGDLVQVTGSRAGKYRVVKGFTYGGIIGMVANERRTKQFDGTYVKHWSASIGQVTEQGYNKITHIFRDGNFVPVKELMEAAE
jgi:hypothetical protein